MQTEPENKEYVQLSLTDPQDKTKRYNGIEFFVLAEHSGILFKTPGFLQKVAQTISLEHNVKFGEVLVLSRSHCVYDVTNQNHVLLGEI